MELVRQRGQICIMDIDVQGAKNIKASGAIPDAKFLFIAPPDMQQLEMRLRGRGTETEEKVQKRLKNAVGEIGFMEENRSFFDDVLVNTDLGLSIKKLRCLLRSWYPLLTQQMLIKAQRGAPFYIRATRSFLTGIDRPAPAEIEITALGNAIPVAAAVAASLEGDGHKVVEVETRLAELTSSANTRKQQVPRICIILRSAVKA